MFSRFKILDEIKQGRVHLYFTRVCSKLLLKNKCQVKVTCQTEQENNVVGECQSIMSDRKRKQCGWRVSKYHVRQKKKTKCLEIGVKPITFMHTKRVLINRLKVDIFSCPGDIV